MSPPPHVANLATPNSDTVENAPSLKEVYTAIGKLCNGWAAGLDDISPELLKCAKDLFSNVLHTLFAKVWITGRVPADWRDAVIVSLYKGKGSKSNCARYRSTSLLSVPGKVFAHDILWRLQPLLHQQQCPQQSGFTASCSMVDAILALQILSKNFRNLCL